MKLTRLDISKLCLISLLSVLTSGHVFTGSDYDTMHLGPVILNEEYKAIQGWN